MRNFRPCFYALMETLRPERGRVGLGVFSGLAEVASSLGFVWASKRVVDVATGQSPAQFGASIAWMCSFMLLGIICRVIQKYWYGYVTVTMQNRLRRDIFARVMGSVWLGREKFHSGDTVNRLEEDIRVCVDFLCTDLPDFLVTLAQIIAASVFLFVLAPTLGWILIFIMPVAVLGSRLFFRKMRHITGEIRAGDSAVQGYIQENLQHRVLVRTLCGTISVLERLGLMQDTIKGLTVRRLDYAAVSRAFLSLGFAAGYAAAFFWGAFGLRDGSVTYGLMVAFLQLVGRVQRPVADITRHIPAFIRALSSQERLMELEELPQELSGAEEHLSAVPGVLLENLSYVYAGKEKPVISGMDFDFKPGTMTVVTGPTGAGKSTLARIMLGLLEPSGGTVSLYDADGHKVKASPLSRCNFMYVPQGNSLMSGTIRRNLLLADPDADEERMKEALHTAAADFVLQLPHGLDTPCSEVGGGLSEGQAQRIAIARALLRPGGILILDEATSALDPATETTLLNRLSGRFNGTKTIICITHREAAASLADSALSVPELPR